MKVVTLDTKTYGAFVFPRCETPVDIHFQEQQGRLLFDPNEVLLETPVRAILGDEICNNIATHERAIQSAWEAMCTANNQRTVPASTDALILSWDLLGTVAVKITTCGVTSADVNRTVYYVLNEADWQHVTLLADAA